MLEPADIAAAVLPDASGALANRRVVVTAGPTREAIDPVRYLSNRSSGKMGYALAQAAVDELQKRGRLNAGEAGLWKADRRARDEEIAAAVERARSKSRGGDGT